MNLTDFMMARKTASNPAKISFRNAWAVFQAWLRKKLIKHLGLDYKYEQIIWRRTQVMKNSPICWAKGDCKVCGCDILGKTMEDRACSISEHPQLMEKRNPCYPEMMDGPTWEAYKQSNNIKLFE